MAVGQSAITITIPVAVDTAKTFVYCNFALSNDGVNEIPRYGLASGTSISLSRASTVGSVDAYWQVVEFS
jgi:hypothetical protein